MTYRRHAFERGLTYREDQLVRSDGGTPRGSQWLSSCSASMLSRSGATPGACPARPQGAYYMPWTQMVLQKAHLELSLCVLGKTTTSFGSRADSPLVDFGRACCGRTDRSSGSMRAFQGHAAPCCRFPCSGGQTRAQAVQGGDAAALGRIAHDRGRPRTYRPVPVDPRQLLGGVGVIESALQGVELDRGELSFDVLCERAIQRRRSGADLGEVLGYLGRGPPKRQAGAKGVDRDA